MWRYHLSLPVLLLALASTLALAAESNSQADARNVHLHTRDPADAFNTWTRERYAHGCIMSIVFIVLYPLGAISIHLPIEHVPYLRNTYLRNKVMAMHAPIQLIGLVLMITGMALGIKVAKYAGLLRNPIQKHVVIGFVVVCTIVVFQPILGALQHRHYKKTGGKSVFAYLHRWIGRASVLLGMINSGLGLQLAKTNVEIPRHAYVRNYVTLGVLVTIWIAFVIYDEFRLRKPVRDVSRAEKGPARTEAK